jgi:hypothetical protein
VTTATGDAVCLYTSSAERSLFTVVLDDRHSFFIVAGAHVVGFVESQRTRQIIEKRPKRHDLIGPNVFISGFYFVHEHWMFNGTKAGPLIDSGCIYRLSS